MFAEACRLVSRFTRPVIIFTRFYDKTVKCGCGAFIVLNDEGWILTAAHLWKSFFAHKEHSKQIAEYNEKVRAIQSNPGLDAKQKSEGLRRLKNNPRWITNHSFWWGWDGVTVEDIRFLPEGDIAVGRLDSYDPKMVETYPVIKDPTSNLDIGTSLCRLGYPFLQIEATFDEKNCTVELAPGTLPLPRFPIEGIYTRNAIAGKSRDGKYEIKFLETSSPGFRGQSGGPVFDVKGTVWAIHSRTAQLPLGFGPGEKKDGQETEEKQFLNVGLGVHPELIVTFLRDNGIRFNLSDY